MNVGVAVGAGFNRRKREVPFVADINYLSANHATAPLTITNPYGDNTCVHQYVIDFLQEFNIATWNGYRYWMGFTPFDVSATPGPEENPCILASSDGVTWVVPDGLTNPIEPAVGGAQYNADVFLYFDKPTLTLYCCWRRSNAYMQEKHSTDGVNWSIKTTMFTYSDSVDHNDYYISPTIVKKGSNLYMYSKDFSLKKVYRHTSNSITGIWSDRQELVFDKTGSLINEIITLVGGEANIYPWHMECRYYKGYYYLLVFFQAALTYPLLWLAKSTDGINFKYSKYPVLSMYYDVTPATNVGDYAWDMMYYKASFIPYIVNNKLQLKLWYVGSHKTVDNFNISQLGYTLVEQKESYITINDSSNSVSAARSAELVKANALTDNYFWGDDCNRANTPLVSSCGKSYALLAAGDVFAMSNNYIINGDTGKIPGLKITGMPLNYDLIIQWINETIGTTTDTAPYIYPKYVSGSNYMLLRNGLHSSRVLMAYSGGVQRLTNSRYYRDFVKSELNEFRMKVNGANIKIWENGIQQIDYTYTVADFSSQATMDACLANTTFAILLMNNTNDKIKNITVKSL